MKFLSNGATADNFPALQHQRLESAFGEIERGNECIVTSADKNYALSDGHGQLGSLAERAAEGATGSAVDGAPLDLPLRRGLLPFLKNDLAGDAAIGAHNAAAGMRGRSAHIKVVHGSAVVSPTGHRAQKK